MNWFLWALIATLLWGGADLFYKRGSNERDKYSHLKIVFVVGLVMGLQAAGMLIWEAAHGGEITFTPFMMVQYLPVSAMYILSMAIGYFGLRYIELSIASPVQNTSGAIVFLLLVVFFGHELDAPSVFAVVLIASGMLALALIEQKQERRLRIPTPDDPDRKYKLGVLAILFPILYALIDALGTFLDGVYLYELELMNEANALYSYEFTFLIAGILCLIYVCGVKRQRFSLFREHDKGVAALLETGGQFFYAYAIGANALYASPMIASYSIVSLLLSRAFLKEKLNRKQYMAIALVMAGIAILGFTQGE